MDIRQQFNLKPYNTLALNSVAEYFCEVADVENVREALVFARQRRLRVTVIGGGSNIVAAPRVPGLVIRMAITGIRKQTLSAESHLIEAGAGENWHQLVSDCLAGGSYGLENLALIPGSCGAAPIQNIGAYGVELEEVFDSLDAVDIASGELLSLDKTACRFRYRNSIFKTDWRDRFVITALRLRLSAVPVVRVEYPALREALSEALSEGVAVTPEWVAQTVCAIRTAKLPDPAQLPNVGSFFKNPIVDIAQAEAIRREYPTLVSYPAGGDKVKLAAAWLIDQAGWKGFQRGSVGVHDRQALVLVNRGGASGKEVLALAAEIADSVKARYGVALELEPQQIGW